MMLKTRLDSIFLSALLPLILPGCLVGVSCDIAGAQPALAAKKSWAIDREHSQIRFKIKSMMVKSVSGQFKNFFGTIDYDGNDIEAAAVNAEIQVNSIDTFNSGRDKHLRTHDFFDTGVYPTMTYKSNRIVSDAKGAFKIYGTLSMHGLSRNVTLDAEPMRSAPRSEDAGNQRLVTTATAILDRKDFGISSGPLDRGGTMVGDQVKIIMDIEITPVQNVARRF